MFEPIQYIDLELEYEKGGVRNIQHLRYIDWGFIKKVTGFGPDLWFFRKESADEEFRRRHFEAYDDESHWD
jgi:hypothetical protein